MRRALPTPAIRTDKGGSRTYIDGTRPTRHGFTDWKKIAKLEVDKASSTNEADRKAMQKEINERKKI